LAFPPAALVFSVAGVRHCDHHAFQQLIIFGGHGLGVSHGNRVAIKTP
jgi:hypothetical protein